MKAQTDLLATPIGWRCMWVVIFFDMPTKTTMQRKRYAQFRKSLLHDGFSMMQYSVYKRHCSNRDNAALHTDRIAKKIPLEGEVRFLTITDRQFGDMRIISNQKKETPEKSPAQLAFF